MRGLVNDLSRLVSIAHAVWHERNETKSLIVTVEATAYSLLSGEAELTSSEIRAKRLFAISSRGGSGGSRVRILSPRSRSRHPAADPAKKYIFNRLIYRERRRSEVLLRRRKPRKKNLWWRWREGAKLRQKVRRIYRTTF